MYTTFLILGIVFILFFSGLLPIDLVAIMAAIALGVSGVLTPQEVFSGFSRSPVITIMAVCILAAGLERTGITEKISDWLSKVSKNNESRLITAVMCASAGLSLFKNNIAAASLILPSALKAGQRAGVKNARVAMPLAFGTLLGGMATYFTTTNIIVSGALRSHDLKAFDFFNYFIVGAPLAICGIWYVSVIGKRSLATQQENITEIVPPGREIDFVELYKLGKEFSALKILPRSPLAYTTLDAGFFTGHGISVIAIQRNNSDDYSVRATSALAEGDLLIVQGALDPIKEHLDSFGLELVPDPEWSHTPLESGDTIIVEVVISPRSTLAGRTLRDVGFRERYGLWVMAIWRAGRPITSALPEQALAFGDALLVRGSRESIRLLNNGTDLLYFGQEASGPSIIPEKSFLSILVMALSLIGSGIDAEHSTEILMSGGLLLVILKILTMEDVYRAIEWKTIFLVAGMLPVGTAIEKTGAAELLGNFLLHTLGTTTPMILLSGVFFITVALTQFVLGPAVATVIAPLAIETAMSLHLNPYAFAMTVAVGTSMAFITPLGHPVNLLVMGPGNYTFRDFIKVGLPLTVLLSILALVVIPFVFPLS